MKMGKKLFCMIAVLVISISCFHNANILASTQKEAISHKRADVININLMTIFGKLEKSPVQFLHDAHTKALAQKNLSCDTCHITKNDRIHSKFKRLEDTNRTEVMNVYHEGCISCHGEMTIAKEKTGPIDCDDCHSEKNKYSSSRQPMGFDKSLHFSHSQVSKNKCEQCHHEYNETKKELFYKKGKEGTCRYCHEKKTIDNRISMRQASHLACINCHIDTVAKEKGQVTPPITCSQCHDPLEQKRFKKKKRKKQMVIPRMDRNQPDVVLLKATPKNIKSDEKRNWMDFVPFDHKNHEVSNETCRTCHHKSLQPCNECHTLSGLSTKLTGGSSNLEKAMHKINSTRSCIGCHNERKQENNCAGCHAPMGKTNKMKEDACIKCHSVPVQNIPNTPNPDGEIVLARSALRSALRSGQKMDNVYKKDDIPKIVTIKSLSKKYEAVQFPHRQVVNAIENRIKDNSLSDYFHNGKETICQGCHHNSPTSVKPPQCESCHSKQWNEDTPLKPGILGAYHQQCMGCHKKMDIKKPIGCTECHKIKNLK